MRGLENHTLLPYGLNHHLNHHCSEITCLVPKPDWAHLNKSPSCSMTGTAIKPHESPAMTVSKSNKFLSGTSSSRYVGLIPSNMSGCGFKLFTVNIMCLSAGMIISNIIEHKTHVWEQQTNEHVLSTHVVIKQIICEHHQQKDLMPGRSESQISISHFHEISRAGKNLERGRLPWKPLENNV